MAKIPTLYHYIQEFQWIKKNTKNKDYFLLILWICSLLFIGFILGSTMKGEINPWYKTLNRSLLTPPQYIFPLAWTLWYTIIAIGGWMIWTLPWNIQYIKTLKILYGAHLLLNWLWTPLFFSLHFIGLSLLCLFIMDILVATILFVSYKKIRILWILIIFYFLWLLFATYLNFHIFFFK